MLRTMMTRISKGEWSDRRIAEKETGLLEKTGLPIRPVVSKEGRKHESPKKSKNSVPIKKRTKKTGSARAS